LTSVCLSPDLDGSHLFVEGLGVAHGSGLVVDGDQIAVGINVGVGSGDVIPVSGLVLADVGL